MALHYLAETAFEDLLFVWRRHDDLQNNSNVALPVLTASRRDLEQSRQRMRRLRLALYPSRTEQETELLAVLCPTIDEIVHLGWAHQTPLFPGTMTCPCGERIPIP
ncbi:MAG: hypothetical protein HKN03_03370 [Acidimicrobiales bacterium]|nr:hypothetical protein [Acidimicrobiales bacterium]